MTESTSFCTEVKDTLIQKESKRPCCRRTYRDSVKAFESPDILLPSAVVQAFRCDNCRNEFLRAAFIHRGSITDPKKEYHLEFSFSDDLEAETVTGVLEEAGFTPGITTRRGRKIAYFKSSETISDVLAYIGALTAAFDIMNNRIVKDMRNNVNRLVNCDTANIGKALSASHKYIEAIEYLDSCGITATLSDELKEAAHLRCKYTQASLGELASRCKVPISKSGMKHRLEKLLSIAKDAADAAEK